jgi:hypothetical protein
VHCSYQIAVYSGILYSSIFLQRKMETINVRVDLKKPYSERRDIASNERNFLICSSCFWCASYLNNMHSFVDVCPSCKDEKVESMPIAFDETYKFDYDAGRGVILEFGRTR